MNLTKEQQEIYDGKQGATLAKVMQRWCATASCSVRTVWCL